MYVFFLAILTLASCALNAAISDADLAQMLECQIQSTTRFAEALRNEEGHEHPALMYYYGKLDSYYEILSLLRYCHDAGPRCSAVCIDVSSSCSAASISSEVITPFRCSHRAIWTSTPAHELCTPD